MLREKLEELKNAAEEAAAIASGHIGSLQGVDGLIERTKALVGDIENVLAFMPAPAPVEPVELEPGPSNGIAVDPALAEGEDA